MFIEDSVADNGLWVVSGKEDYLKASWEIAVEDLSRFTVPNIEGESEHAAQSHQAASSTA